MREDTKKLLRLAGLASTIGLQLVIATVVGLAIGVWLDSTFGTLPWLTLLFMVFGIVAGFLNYYRFARKQQEEDRRD
jgi:ATP synthase protein I